MSFVNSVREGSVRLLRWSERYTQVDMVYAVSGGFWLSVGYVASSASSFILAIVFANVLDPNIYGSYKYVLSVASILSIGVLPGIDASLVRAVSRGKEAAMFTVMRTRILWGISANICALGVAAYYYAAGNQSLAAAFLVIALFISIMDPLASYDDFLRGRREFKVASTLAILGQITSTIILAGVALWHPTLPLIAIAYFGGWTLIRGILLLYTLRTYPPNREPDPDTIPYGKHLTAMKAASTIAGSIGSILLFHVSGVELAIFSIAVAPIEQVRGLIGLVDTLTSPKFSQDSWQTWTVQAMFTKTRYLFIIFAIGIVFYIIAAPYLFALLFPKYLASVPFTQAWSVSLMLTIASIFLSSILRAKREVRKLYVFNTASIVTTLVFTPPLTYLFGIWGLLVGQYATKLVETGVLSYLTFRTTIAFSENKNMSNEGEPGSSANK